MSDFTANIEQVDGSIDQSIDRFCRAAAVLATVPRVEGIVISSRRKTFDAWLKEQNSLDSQTGRVLFHVPPDAVRLTNGKARLVELRKRAESAAFRILAVRAEIWTIQILLATLIEALKGASTERTAVTPASLELQCLADALRFHLADERVLLQAAEQSGSIGMVVLRPNGVSDSACFAQVVREFYQTYDCREDSWHEDAGVVGAFREKGISSHTLLVHLSEETERIRAGVMVLQQRKGNGVGHEADCFEGQLEAIEDILVAPEHIPDVAQSLSGAFRELRDTGRATYQEIERWLEGRCGLIEVWTPVPDLEDLDGE